MLRRLGRNLLRKWNSLQVLRIRWESQWILWRVSKKLQKAYLNYSQENWAEEKSNENLEKYFKILEKSFAEGKKLG